MVQYHFSLWEMGWYLKHALENHYMKKVALITGASKGIGRAFCHEHAKNHGDVVAVARSTSQLQTLKVELESQYGVEVLPIPKDLSIPDSAQELYDELQDKEIHIDYLINNAGFGDSGRYHETSWEREEMMINVNILALAQLTKLFGSDMVNEQYGKILNVSSTAAFQPGPLMTTYYATKHFVQAYSEALYEEWKDFNVTVTALCPGATESEFAKAADMQDSKLFTSRKLPSAEEVAAYGYQAMLDGKMVAIHGALNNIMAQSVKFFPKKLGMKIVRKLQE